MSFNEKLQNLRKENKYSQEELADMLDVTRQSVSKWESGQTYPEMDKLLAICKIFNCSLDELTNDEVKEISRDKKNNFTSLVDSVLEFINKTYKMFANMSFKEMLKCFLVMGVVGIILLFFLIPVEGLESAFYHMVDAIGRPAVAIFASSLFNIIIDLCFGILYILIFVYIFKIGFLDKYEFTYGKEPAKEEKKVINEEKPEIKEEKKIIVNEKKNNDYKIFHALGAIVMFFVKFFLVFFAIPFFVLLLFLFGTLVLEIYLLSKGIVVISVLLYIIFGIIINIVILEVISNIIFDRKSSYTRLLITFIFGMAGIGVATGVLFIDLNSFTYYNNIPANYELTKETYEYEFNDEMYFMSSSYYSDVNYVIDNSLKEKVVLDIEYYKDFNSIIISGNKEYYIYNTGFEITNYKNYLNFVIDSLKKKQIYSNNDFYTSKITVYAKEANINKLKENLDEYYEEEIWFQNEIDYYENRISELENQIYELEDEKDNYAYEKEDLLSEIESLKEEIVEYKDKIKSILE